MIICITGLPAAGKSSVGMVLKEEGFRVYELGDMIRRMMKEHGIELTPESDKKFIVSMRKRYGKFVFVERFAKKVNIGKASNIAIVGVRSRPELEYLKRQAKNVVTIAILAPSRLRFERMKERKRPDAQRTYAEFLKRDRREIRFGLWGAIDGADYVIAGTGTIPQLRNEVERILKLLG